MGAIEVVADPEEVVIRAEDGRKSLTNNRDLSLSKCLSGRILAGSVLNNSRGLNPSRCRSGKIEVGRVTDKDQDR